MRDSNRRITTTGTEERTWRLLLEVPPSVFASVEEKLQEIEKAISAKLKHFDRTDENNHLGEVTIVPSAVVSATAGRVLPAVESIESRRLWGDGKVRLFLSHLAIDRADVSRVKDALALRGVAAFVAHEDIEPSRQWQHEIELALQTMHALAALVTPAFHGSNWTDQEVGWALGRGVPVLPVRLGQDPYGLFGKLQGISGSLNRSSQLAELLVAALLKNPATSAGMRRSLLRAFQAVNSFADAQSLKPLILLVKDYSEVDRDILWKACPENDQTYGANGVVRPFFGPIGNPPQTYPKSQDDEAPF